MKIKTVVFIALMVYSIAANAVVWNIYPSGHLLRVPGPDMVCIIFKEAMKARCWVAKPETAQLGENDAILYEGEIKDFDLGNEDAI